MSSLTLGPGFLNLFFDLPLELRRKIYGCSLRFENPVVHRSVGRRFLGGKIKYEPFVSNILLVSKEINNEVLDTLYDGEHFRVCAQ